MAMSFLDRSARSASLAGRKNPHRRTLEMEGLEGRQLLATLDSVAYDSVLNLQVNDVVYGNGSLYQFQAKGGSVVATELASSGVKSAGIAFSQAGTEVEEIVLTDGAAYQIDSQGTHYLGAGVESDTVTFNAHGDQVNTVVYAGGALYQFNNGDSGHFLGNNVASACLSSNLAGNAVEDVVFTDGDLYEFDSADNSSHLLATGVISASEVFGTAIGEVQEVVYGSGEEFQYQQNAVAGLFAVGVLGSNSSDNGKIF